MFCTQCGAQQDDNAMFCTVCGASLQQSQPTPIPMEQPAPAPVVEQPVYEQPAPVVEQPVYAQPAPVVEQPVYAQPVQPTQPVYGQPNQPVYSQPNQPVQPMYAQPVQQKVPGKGLAVAGMVLGIVSLVLFACYGFIAGILAIIFGAVAKGKGYKGGMGTAGIVCGAISIGIWILLFLFAESLIASLVSDLSRF